MTQVSWTLDRLGRLPGTKESRCRRHPPPYPAEFREEAVRLAKSSGARTAEIAADLGISYETLRKCPKQDQVDGGNAPGLTTNEREELRKLHRENRILREEREILRKAAAFFARETR